MLKRLITLCLIFVSGLSYGQSAAQKYIDLYKEAAIQIMNEHGIPASIVLGIAIHESASGTSRIARYLNNHFGIKGSSGPKSIKSAYKGYPSVKDSYEDFVSFLERKNPFKTLFDRYSADDYKNWARGIQRGGYAQSTVWASQVLAIIKKYNLHDLDEEALDMARNNKAEPDVQPLETASNQVKKEDESALAE